MTKCQPIINKSRCGIKIQINYDIYIQYILKNVGLQQHVLSETICGLSPPQFFVALAHSILDGTTRLFTTRCHHNYFWLLLLPGRSLPPLRNHTVYTDKMCYPTFTVRIIIEKNVYSTDHLISFGRLRQDFSL